ncbi:MAG TPA: GDP-L-fucose synthase [Bacteroidales bacterium]|nr:GDP-L-fucose synthase [Bacteroidales bacterium]
MEKDARIYIAGHQGMVGSAITRGLHQRGYAHVTGRTLEELDLTDQRAVAAFFDRERPEYVVVAAAKVGGILANNTYRAQFIYENLMIEANIIHHAYLSGVKKLLFLGSSCIYPRDAPQPLKEEYLLTGELEKTNEPYAIAKIAGIKLCESYHRQYGCNFLSVMPTNLYGPNDNYNLETSHVLPAIIRKMHLARSLETGDWQAIRADLNRRPVEGVAGSAGEPEILAVMKKYGIRESSVSQTGSEEYQSVSPVTLTLWGTGRVYREFMHVDDMAAACIHILEKVDAADLVAGHLTRGPGAEHRSDSPITDFLNIGTGIDQTIAEVAGMVKEIVGFRGGILWDHSKPDGTLKKLMDVSRLREMGITSHLSLEEGIQRVYRQYYRENQLPTESHV